jgi:hypothetical protein
MISRLKRIRAGGFAECSGCVSGGQRCLNLSLKTPKARVPLAKAS